MSVEEHRIKYIRGSGNHETDENNAGENMHNSLHESVVFLGGLNKISSITYHTDTAEILCSF